MGLGTFGAIVSFGMQLEQQALDFYQSAAGQAQKALFDDLAKGSQKRFDRLQRARQELVAEMILESITGLEAEDYTLELDAQSDESALLDQAKKLEKNAASYYQAAADKMPIKEVVRLFERMIRENEKRLAKLP